jgi:hypothetical protein
MQKKGLKENVREFIIFEHHANLFQMIKNNQKDDGKIAHRGAKVRAAKRNIDTMQSHEHWFCMWKV